MCCYCTISTRVTRYKTVTVILRLKDIIELIWCYIYFYVDGTALSAYQLTDGSKLNLILKREAGTPTPGSAPDKQNCGKEEEHVGTFEEELFKSLRKHFKSDIDTKAVVNETLKVKIQWKFHN